MEYTLPVCPSKGSPTTAPVSTSQIRMVLSKDPEMTWRPSGENLRQVTLLRCPLHRKGGTGHDNDFPLCILIALVNRVLNIIDNGDSDGRNGCVEI